MERDKTQELLALIPEGRLDLVLHLLQLDLAHLHLKVMIQTTY